MASTYSDVLLDFDLDFLHQNTSGSVVPTKNDKFRKQVLVAKRRTIAVDALIRKYYEKKEEKDLVEKHLLDSKEECKQACIKYNNAIQKLSNLEEKDEKLQSSYKELQKAYSSSENRCHAIQSHANQLQLLVKENDTKLEALRIENQLEKSCKKDFEKKISALEKELSTLEKKVEVLGKEKHVLQEHISVISEVALGKKKIKKDVKLLLYKYVSGGVDNGALSEEDSDTEITKPAIQIQESYEVKKLHCNEVEAKIDGMNPETIEEEIVKACASKHKQGVTNDVCDVYHDSECSNGIISSEDTGRGSSLTFSDSEKCLQSPDYFSTDSPSSLEPIKQFSPKDLLETANKATSPIFFEETPIKLKQQRATSPIRNITQFKDVATSPMVNKYDENKIDQVEYYCTVQDNNSATSPAIEMVDLSVNTSDSVKTKISTNQEKVFDEKNYLEQNNSNILCINENSEDYEVTRILSSMSLHKKLITPLPPSPNPTTITNITDSVTNNEISENSEFNTLFQHIVKLLKDVNDIKSNVPKLTDIRKVVNEVCDERDKKKGEICTNFIINNDNRNRAIRKNDDKHIYNNLFGDEENDSVTSNDDTQTSMDASLNHHQTVINMEVINRCDNNNEKELRQSFGERLIIEEPLSSDKDVNLNLDTNNINNSRPVVVPEVPQICDINLNVEESNNNRVRQPCKRGKVSKLERLRKGLQPRCKIRPADVPVKTSKVKCCQISSQTQQSKELMARLNNKSAYEKALVVVAEFRAKQKNKIEINKSIKPRKAKSNVNVTVDAPVTLATSNNSDAIPLIEVNSIVTHETATVIQNDFTDKVNEPNTKSESQLPQHCVSPLIEKHQTNWKQGSRNEKCSEISELLSSTVAKQSQKKVVENVPTPCESVQFPNTLNEPNKNSESDVRPIKATSAENTVTRRNSLKRSCVDKLDVQPKRVLRSSNIRLTRSELAPVENSVEANRTETNCKEVAKDYSDLQLFTDFNETATDNNVCNLQMDTDNPKNSVLCQMIKKYGSCSKNSRPVSKIPNSRTNQICTKLEEEIAKVAELQGAAVKIAMNELIIDIQSWNYKHFMSGLIKYLKDPERKTELFGKTCVPPSPPMTKAEQILLYVITQLQISKQQGWSTTVTDVLKNIEYTIFRLNQTPDFNTIESMSHFYAVLCRYTRAKNRLRLFMLDAMYCISFKAIPLIKQCIDVWSHVLPLARLRMGKSPLVLCIVYLLHFYKCDDFMNRVQEIRIILQRRYSFEMGEWNETQILKTLRNAVLELSEIPIEKKMLRTALILMAKRHGPKWSQKNIVKDMLLSMIEKNDLPDRVKQFCLSVLGPILKPFPNDMKVHCEIVMNQLIDILEQNCSHEIDEAVISSLLYMNKHNSYRVNEILLSWKPKKEISQDLEELLRDFVRDRPIKVWKRLLSNIRLTAE